MKIPSVSPTREAQPCPSPLTVWQTLLAYLLQRHYGLTMNDTAFSDDDVIHAHIDAGISLAGALNAVVRKYDLARIDRGGLSFHQASPYLNSVDVLRARRAAGLSTAHDDKVVTAGTASRRMKP